jgi:ribosome-binding protein aMBF1 (putative translation factor)
LSVFLISLGIGAFRHRKDARVISVIISYIKEPEWTSPNIFDREERPWISGGWLENVRRYRKEAELSQEVLVARMGVEQDYVSRFEVGKRNPAIITIWHAAEALGVRPAVLFRTRSQRSQSTKKRKKARKLIFEI